MPPKAPYTDLWSLAVTLSKAMEPESCTEHKLSFCFTFLCDSDLGQRTLILIMTYHLIIVYLFIKSIKLASVETQRKDLTFNLWLWPCLKCRNQCLVCGIPLKMPHLSVKFNDVCFGTFLGNCCEVFWTLTPNGDLYLEFGNINMCGIPSNYSLPVCEASASFKWSQRHDLTSDPWLWPRPWMW